MNDFFTFELEAMMSAVKLAKVCKRCHGGVLHNSGARKFCKDFLLSLGFEGQIFRFFSSNFSPSIFHIDELWNGYE